jgi:hypothetical protein
MVQRTRTQQRSGRQEWLKYPGDVIVESRPIPEQMSEKAEPSADLERLEIVPLLTLALRILTPAHQPPNSPPYTTRKIDH